MQDTSLIMLCTNLDKMNISSFLIIPVFKFATHTIAIEMGSNTAKLEMKSFLRRCYVHIAREVHARVGKVNVSGEKRGHLYQHQCLMTWDQFQRVSVNVYFCALLKLQTG